MPSHYETLGVQPGANMDVIKAAYRQLVLQLHPDKQQVDATPEKQPDSTLVACRGPSGTAPSLQDVHAAWSVLRNPAGRQEYDRMLSSAAVQATIAPWDSVTWEEMDALDDSTAEARSYECRCGDQFTVTAADIGSLEHGNLYLPCRTCGNVLEVTV